MTPDQLLDRAVLTDPARPLLTFYDDATDERVELSVVTFANWVAKTANLLVDGLGAQPGQRVSLHLPVHWQAAVWHAACWAAGLVTVTGAGGGRTDIAVVALDPAETAATGAPVQADEIIGLGLGPLGLARRDVALPAGVTLDYDREIHSYGDRFALRAGDDSDQPALQVGDAVHTGGYLGSEAAARVAAGSLVPGARILSVLAFDHLAGILVGLLVPLANGGGTVLCRRLDRGRLAARVTTERVTAVTGLPADVLPDHPRVT